MNSSTGTQVVAFSGNASNSLKSSAAYLNANNTVSNSNANIGARNLSLNQSPNTVLPLPLGKIVCTPNCVGSNITKTQERQV